MSEPNRMPDLFAGLAGDDNENVTTSIDGDKRQRARNKQREYRQSTPAELAKMEADAIANGTYRPIDEWRTVCTGCRQWVNKVYHANPQNTREHFCINCCPADVREMVQAAEAKRHGTASEDVAAMYGDQPASEPPLPDGVTRAEDVGLPEQ
jgi:hypothetical protein